jgi:hypothetical protein
MFSAKYVGHASVLLDFGFTKILTEVAICMMPAPEGLDLQAREEAMMKDMMEKTTSNSNRLSVEVTLISG